MRCPVQLIEQFVASRRPWLDAQKRRLEALPAPWAPRYEAGGAFGYLGEPLTLALHTVPGRRAVQRQEGLLLCSLPPDRAADGAAIERCVRQWYAQESLALYGERLACLWEQMPWLAAQREFPTLRVRSMRRQWGSCSSRGVICMNIWLLMQPLECIDYVIAHELCHLLEMNHGPRFYAQLERVMPDWRARRARLASAGAMEL